MDSRIVAEGVPGDNDSSDIHSSENERNFVILDRLTGGGSRSFLLMGLKCVGNSSRTPIRIPKFGH